ncbi:CoxG family protein [Neorhizobium sp. DT-125]|uniref:CoxG family protein n=1 Tax=Neorhizobium sp. DT-125 TaxID=3396163 RepID=UPI003F1A141D
MEMKGAQHIGAAQHIVWAALLDPAVLKSCVPGCQEMAGTPATGFEATVVQRVGPVKATFKGVVTLEEMNEPGSLVLRGEGKGGAAGFAKGGAHVRLTPSDDGTTLDYHAEAQIGGKLAQLGSRLIDGFAKKMADEFFLRFKTVVENRTVGV